MAVHRKEYQHLVGLRLYLIYPFNSSLTEEEFKNTVMELYGYGIVPIIAATYLVPRNFHILDVNNIQQTIGVCEGAILVRDEHLTRVMASEIAYAKRIGLPVYTF